MTTNRRYRLGVMLGDGIGPEIVPASVRVVDAALAAAGAGPVDWHELALGASAIEQHGSAIPPTTMAALAELDGWLLGPHDSAAYPEPFRSQLNPSGAVRQHFDLYANIRPARGFEGGNAIAPDTDLVIVRENTEGFYADRNTYAGTGSSCPLRTWRSVWASSPGPPSSGSRGPPRSWPGAGGTSSRSCTRRTSCS
jgi:3-isopropylmalate dehydrogenase